MDASLIFAKFNPQTQSETHTVQVPPENYSQPTLTRRQLLLNILKKTVVSQLFITALVFTYVAMVIQEQTDTFHPCTLVSWQARTGYTLFVRRQVWRLVSAIFLHQNPLHLVTNVIGAMYLMPAVEYTMPSPIFAAILLVSCLTCGTTSSLLSPYKINCGASGPVMLFLAINLLNIVSQAHNQPRIITIYFTIVHFTGLAICIASDIVFHNISDIYMHWSSVLFGTLSALIYKCFFLENLAPRRVQFLATALLIMWMVALPIISMNQDLENISC